MNIELTEDILGEVIATATASLTRQLSERLEAQLRGDIMDIVRERIVARADALIDEVLAGPIVETSRWGERKGQPMTILELVEDRAKGALVRKVNHKGHPDNYGKQTYIDFVVNQGIRHHVHKQVTEIASAALESFDDLIAEQVKAALKRRR